MYFLIRWGSLMQQAEDRLNRCKYNLNMYVQFVTYLIEIRSEIDQPKIINYIHIYTCSSMLAQLML